MVPEPPGEAVKTGLDMTTVAALTINPNISFL